MSNRHRSDSIGYDYTKHLKKWTRADLPDSNLVSVIVAVYNVEQYLRECVDSLLCQEHEEIEIILVDDGSTDNSGDICEFYSQNDNRVHVIHQKNAGLSAARNVGTKLASGAWIVYVDADDAVDNHYISEMLNAARKNSVPIISCKFRIFYNEMPDQSSETLGNGIVLEGVEAACEVLSEKRASTSAWGKLAIASLWKSVEFPEGRKYEDLPVTWKLFIQSERAVLLQDELYFYRQRPKSISDAKSASLSSIKDYSMSIQQMLNETSSSEYSIELKSAAAFRSCLECCRLYEMCQNISIKNASIGEVKRFTSRCLKMNMKGAISNQRAPIIQRARIAAMAIAPSVTLKAIRQLVNLSKQRDC